METQAEEVVEWCICYCLLSEILGTPFVIEEEVEGYLMELSTWMAE